MEQKPLLVPGNRLPFLLDVLCFLADPADLGPGSKPEFKRLKVKYQLTERCGFTDELLEAWPQSFGRQSELRDVMLLLIRSCMHANAAELDRCSTPDNRGFDVRILINGAVGFFPTGLQDKMSKACDLMVFNIAAGEISPEDLH